MVERYAVYFSNGNVFKILQQRTTFTVGMVLSKDLAN